MYYQVDTVGDDEQGIEDNNVEDSWKDVSNQLALYRFKPNFTHRELRIR